MQTFEQRVIESADVDEYGELDRSAITKLNRAMRAVDESHLWPIRGRFNLTERAIRQARDLMRANGPMGVFEYLLVIDGMIGRMVNDPRNF